MPASPSHEDWMRRALRLGVRILGEVKKEYADLLRLADAIFIEELRRDDYYHKTSQAFAVFLPVTSVGVVGDGRHDRVGMSVL